MAVEESSLRGWMEHLKRVIENHDRCQGHDCSLWADFAGALEHFVKWANENPRALKGEA